MKRYRITSKVRFTIFIIAVVFVIMTLLGAAMPGPAANAAKVTYRTVEVDYGDTLWAIAKKHAPEGSSIRKFIYEIRDVNGLETSEIYAGQTILVPAA